MKIISGGQTGADRGALEAAAKLGIETGGHTVKMFKTENGCDFSLQKFGLVDDCTSYPKRTAANVYDADITLWCGHTGTAGYRATRSAAKKFGKPFKTVTAMKARDIIQLIKGKKVVNIAGNRESHNIGIQEATEIVFTEVLHEFV